MKKALLFALLFSAIASFAETTYTSGVFILNEDWYSHNNSTLNHLSYSGEFSYRILQAANDAPTSLGCTSQFAAIYGDKFYFVSKQSQDPGEQSNRRGARLVVTDATTLKLAYSIDTLFAINGKYAADGRGFVGVDETKGYVGSSNGIFVLDFASQRLTKRIAGTENPLISGGEHNTDGTGPLYQNQIGIMLRTHDYVFAIQQDLGIHVIDPVADTIITTMRGCFSTMTQSKDGRIWAARNTNTEWQTYPYGGSGESWQGNELFVIDPATLSTTTFDLRDFCGDDNMMVEQTWYAWTAGSLCASLRENVLFFSYNENIWDWYNGRVHIYKFDIDNLSLDEIYTTTDLGDYYIYNSGAIRVHPLTGNLFVGCFKSTISTNDWLFLQITPTGELVRTYTPIKNYWYPSLFIFPDMYAPEVKDFATRDIHYGQVLAIPLDTLATDSDNLSAAITKRVLSISDTDALSASVHRDTLFVTALSNENKKVEVTVRFNSNGKTVDRTLAVNIRKDDTAITNNYETTIRLLTQGSQLLISGVNQPTTITVYDTLGRMVYVQTTNTDTGITLTQGMYIVHIGDQTYRIII